MKLFGITPQDVNEEFVNDRLKGYDIPQLTYKRAKILAILTYINGINKKGEDGMFFLTNNLLMELAGLTSECHFIEAISRLVELGLIERVCGSGRSATRYKVTLVMSKKGSPKHENGSPKAYKKGSPLKSKIESKKAYPIYDQENKKEISIIDNGSENTLLALMEEVRQMKDTLNSIVNENKALKSENEKLKSEMSMLRKQLDKSQVDVICDGGASNIALKEERSETQLNSSFSSSFSHDGKHKQEVYSNKPNKAETAENKIGRLLYKLNNKSYITEELLELQRFRKQHKLTRKQEQMFYAISHKYVGFSSIPNITNKAWSLWRDNIDKWVTEIGKAALEMSSEELTERVQEVMGDFKSKTSKVYFMHTDDTFGYDLWLDKYCEKTYERVLDTFEAA